MQGKDVAPGIATSLIHPTYDGPLDDERHAPGPVAPSVVRSATYRLDIAGEEALATGRDADRLDIYGRHGTPTTRQAASLVARLEGAEAGLLFSSGSAATATIMSELVPPGGVVAAADALYGGTEVYLREELGPRNVEVLRFDARSPGSLADVLGRPRKPDLVWCESISNPLLHVAPLTELAGLCSRAGVALAVDNTFGAGLAVRPLSVGATLVMHSATKFMNGHSDVVAGAVCGAGAIVRRLWAAMTRHGCCIDPQAAWLLARGMKTLPLRWRRQCETAERLAEALAQHESVARVHYPGLASHPSHDVARRELSANGAMVSFEVGTLDAALRLLRGLRLCIHATSLGGVETLACSPARTSHARLPASERRARGIADGLIRVSVGLEDFDDLWIDFKRALGRV